MQTKLFDDEEEIDDEINDSNEYFTDNTKSVFNEQLAFIENKKSILEQLRHDPEYIKNKRKKRRL